MSNLRTLLFGTNPLNSTQAVMATPVMLVLAAFSALWMSGILGFIFVDVPIFAAATARFVAATATFGWHMAAVMLGLACTLGAATLVGLLTMPATEGQLKIRTLFGYQIPIIDQAICLHVTVVILLALVGMWLPLATAVATGIWLGTAVRAYTSLPTVQDSRLLASIALVQSLFTFRRDAIKKAWHRCYRVWQRENAASAAPAE